jgi:hypothetical protein
MGHFNKMLLCHKNIFFKKGVGRNFESRQINLSLSSDFEPWQINLSLSSDFDLGQKL